MYTLTFNNETISDLLNHRSEGRQFFGAVVIPYSGVFTSETNVYTIDVPRILCPYQINDLIVIQERWARDASGEYVYESDSIVSNYYNYRPAYTMPNEAARMYGRIVSAVPWLVNLSIANKYLLDGMSLDNCTGTAKVYDTTDTANKMLKNIRDLHNKSALNKTYQPSIHSIRTPPIKYVPYQLSQQYTPSLLFVDPDGVSWNLNANHKSDAAIAYYAPFNYLAPGLDPQRLAPNQYGYTLPVDSENAELPNGDWVNNLGSWTTYPTSLTISEAEALENAGYHLVRRGLAYDSEETSGSNAKYIYVMLDETGHAIPIYAYYPVETIDSDQQVFAWLISGYLCEKDGTIIGNWF